ncbi:hypothetical protein M2A_1754 [Tepidicaulis marinus]|uniref:Flagellar assembly protein FliH/Type III secretion system HrpE domain-containing protein n=2 Tax=Tepidicaulis marinus TaxID=1333998 RepID=A0A081BB37_9HYPH|nr:hypothetical protein M2A_1754 [Tepidicaulis marinus]
MGMAATRPYAFEPLDKPARLAVVEEAETPEKLETRLKEEFAAQLDEARAEAFAQGKSEGVREGRLLAERDSSMQARQVTLDLLSEITRGVGLLDEETCRLEKEALGAVKTFFSQLAPRLMEETLAARCETLLQDAFLQLADSRQLLIGVHPGAAASVEALLASVEVPAGVEVLVRAQEALPAGGIDIRWAHGGVSFDPAAILALLAPADGAAQNDMETREEGEAR